MPIVENWSRIRGRVEAWDAPAKPGDSGTLTIAVDHVEAVATRGGPPHPNLLTSITGTTVKVVVPASAADGLSAHKGATAVIEVRQGTRSRDVVFAHPERIVVTP